jgi:hypothetical protein
VHLSYEWKVPPSALLDESPRMIATMHRYLRWRSSEMRKASR